MICCSPLSMPVRRPLVRLISLPPAALQPPSAVVMMHRSPTMHYRSNFFSLHIYPLHSRIDQSRASRMPPLLGPSWLPFPPSPDTHESRHMRRYQSAMQDRKNGIPRLHTAVLIGKKRVHKHAVVRDRCRKRLMAALQALTTRKGVQVHSTYAYIFFGTADLYSATLEDIEQQLRRALGHVAVKLAKRPPPSSKLPSSTATARGTRNIFRD